MGYPDSALASDEQVVLHRHPHWKRLVGPVLALLVTTALASFAAAVVSRTDWEPHIRQGVSAGIAASWLLLVLWLTLRPFLAWKATHFVLTDRRVMYRHGVLTKAGIDIPLARINSVEFRRGLFDRLARTGTLVIESASQDPLEFRDIPQVEYVHSLLYHEVVDHEVFDDRES
ncbi:MAG: PH domain-containing protein [Mycobacterium sp.]